jgi:hypothetical protein
MKHLIFLLLFASTLFLATCEKNKSEDETTITIEGFYITDANGNQLGTVGNVADDWKISDWSQLTTLEKSFLSFSDNVNLDGTVATNTFNNPVPYPNPFHTFSAIQFHAGDSVKLKVAVVDSLGQVLKTFSGKMKGYKVFYFDFTDITGDPLRKSLRFYYSFSATGQLNYRAGYGDVRLCRGTVGGGPYTQCF